MCNTCMEITFTKENEQFIKESQKQLKALGIRLDVSSMFNLVLQLKKNEIRQAIESIKFPTQAYTTCPSPRGGVF